MAKRLPILIVSAFLFFQSLYSQSDSVSFPKPKFSPSFHLNPGMIVKNYPGVPEDFLAGFASVNWSFQTLGSDRWHAFCNFPKAGIETVFGYFNSPALGITIGVVPNLEFRGKRNFYLKVGFGACYFSKPYDLVSNPTNLYIGRPFTNMTIFSAGHSTVLNKKLALNYGITFIHSSDGHTALPNVGMNCLLLNLGLGFYTPVPRGLKSEPPPGKKKFVYTVKTGIGFHEFGATTKAVGGPSYPNYHLSAYVSKPFGGTHLVDGGITLSYYTSFYDFIISQEVYNEKQTLRSCTGVIYLGHEFVFGKFGFTSQLGLYFYNPFFIEQKKMEGSWNVFSEKIEAFNTNKIGLVYYPFKKRNTLNKLNKQLVIGAYIKANLGQADLFEYSVGYRF